MKTLLAAVAAMTAFALPSVAGAQATAPDGSPAFGIEPYVGVLGGYDLYDSRSEFGAPSARRGGMDGALLSGIAGVNLPLGPVFVGAEGNATKGFKDIDWEYGAKGRVGVRAGESGMIYVSAGYQWVNGRSSRGYGDHSDWLYGAGVEVGPKDIGLGLAGARIRLQADTYDFHSIRPMAGVIFHL